MNVTYRYLINKQHFLGEGFRLFLAVALLVIVSAGMARAGQPVIPDSEVDVTVYKTEFCGCCSKWTAHLEQSGLTVNEIIVTDTSPVRTRLGVPGSMTSCHTAVVGEYWVEGHVPADLISRLMQEKPKNIRGISVPGMPPGSPGMEAPNPSVYEVFSVNDAGEVAIYATRQGRSSR